MIKLLLSFLLFFFLTDTSGLLADDKKPTAVSKEAWESAKPYFIPSTHPAKKILDRLFADQKTLESPENMVKAGFQAQRLHSSIKNNEILADIYIVTHPQLKGYVLKVYLDDYQIPELEWWIKRINGLERVKLSVAKNGYQHLMKYPEKMIYPLPHPKKEGRAFILIENDLHVVSNEENARRYKTRMTKELMRALFTVLNETNLYDLIYIDNIPFSTDGRLAFVDTEDFDRKPLKLDKMTSNFSESMQEYWNSLIVDFK